MDFKKSIKMFGKAVPIWIIASLAMAGVGSAALLTVYGTITATVNVQQAIGLDGVCSSTIDVAGSETGYMDTCSIKSNTVNDLAVKFSNTCSPDCGGITVTNRVGLGVIGFEGSEDAFAKDFYKATDYNSPVGSLDDLNSVTTSFKVIENTFGNDNLAPYVVIVGSGLPYDVAVEMVPSGTAYVVGTEYTGTIDSNSLFHVPGDIAGTTACTQADPCTLAELKAKYPGVSITKVRYALGAWPATHSNEMEVSMGVSEINGVQAVHKSVKIYGGATVPTVEKYDFDALIVPGTYTIDTTVDPA